MRDIEIAAQKIIADMKAIGIPVEDDKITGYRMEDCEDFGRCDCTVRSVRTCNQSRMEYLAYEIIINQTVAEQGRGGLLEATICHELLHTCQGSREHSRTFYKRCWRLQEAYGYQMMTVPDSIRYMNEPVLMRTTCQSCGLTLEIHNPVSAHNIQTARTMWRRCECGHRYDVKYKT